MPSPLTTRAPYKLIAAAVAERLASGRDPLDPLAPWAEEVIAASSGVSQAIAEGLVERLPKGVAGLQMQSIETLARRIVNAAGEFPRVASEQERRLAMRTATRSLDDPLTTTRGAAAMLERSYRDVRDSALTLGDFSRRVSAKTLRNRERIRLVIRAWQLYERLVARLGAIDPADLLMRAADLVAAGLGPQASGFIVAGFYDMTGAQEALVRALQSVDGIVAVYTPQPAPAITPLVHEAKTREEEIRATCSEIAQLLDGGTDAKSIGVVARSLDPYDVQLLERFSRQHGFAVTESVPLALSAHRFGRAVVALVRLREQNFPRHEVLEIVRSGLKLETRINADKADEHTRYATVAGGRSADLRQRTFKSPAIGDYIEAVAELESLTERFDAAWLHRIAERFRIETAIDAAAAGALHDIASLFERAESWNRPFDTSALIEQIESCELPRTESCELRTVWLGDVMRLRGRSFEHLFAVRMQDDIVPQRRVEDPLLVDEDRDRIGIRRIGDGRAEEQLLFEILRDAATKSLTMSFAASDGFGKPLRKSHYLRGFLCSVARPRATPAAEAAAATRPLQLLVKSGTRSIFDGYVRSAIVREKVEQVLQSVSPTQLEDFGECPQKFFWKHVLKVRALDDPEMEMQLHYREKGKLDHRILERFYREAAGDQTMLDRLVDEEFDRLEEELPPFNPPIRRIERQATKRVLHAFVIDDVADLEEQALAPTHFEYKFDPVTLDIHGTPLHVGGTIDRVDRGGERYRIVDYKSGKAGRHNKLAAKIDRGVRLQLALYAMAAVDLFHTPASQVSGVIKPIAGTARLDHFSFQLAEHDAQLRDTLALFVEAMRRGDFPAFPHENDEYDACKYCPVNHSCRTRHDADEHRIVMRYDDPRALLEENRE